MYKVIVVMLLVLAVIFGYFANIYKAVAVCDWQSDTSWKCEVVRSVGVFVPPVGVIAGYISINP